MQRTCAAVWQRGGVESSLRRRILDETDLPYTLVEIDEAWRLPWNQHPDARASHAIAARLQESK